MLSRRNRGPANVGHIPRSWNRYIQAVAAGERPGVRQAASQAEAGDVLILTKLDRLGRNAMDVRATVERLAAIGVRIHCLALGGVDLTSAAGKMTMGVLNAVAEFERDLLIERTQARSRQIRGQGVGPAGGTH
ncbi:recombinase family protein [Cupriavidus necator]